MNTHSKALDATKLPPSLIDQMRDWAMDCTWEDEDFETLRTLSDAQIVRGIEQHYCGGVAQFIRDSLSFQLDCEPDRRAQARFMQAARSRH